MPGAGDLINQVERVVFGTRVSSHPSSSSAVVSYLSPSSTSPSALIFFYPALQGTVGVAHLVPHGISRPGHYSVRVHRVHIDTTVGTRIPQ
jgi:hypothetical protein